MGNAKIWFTPSADLGPRTSEINFGSKFSNRTGPTPVVFRSSTEAMSGERVQTWQGGRHRTTFEYTWDARAAGDGRLIRRQVVSLINHLARGGTCKVAEDATYAFAAFASPVPNFNDNTIVVGRTLFYPTIAVGSDITGREVLIQSDPDSFLVEMKTVTTWTAAVGGQPMGLNGRLLFDYGGQASWVLVREYGSYVCQRLPADVDPGQILQHNHENSWSISLPLEDDPAALLSSLVNEGDADGGVSGGGGGINPADDEPGSVLQQLPYGTGRGPVQGGWWVP